MRIILYLGIIIATCLSLFSNPGFAQSSSAVALTGTVTSDAEGPMEGVIVRAKRVGGTITISVVTDSHGVYAFPSEKIKPGPYSVSVRATGYDVPNRAMAVTVNSDSTKVDLKLNKVSPAVLVEQLTPAEVVRSLPGTPEQVRAATGCGGCHSFARVLKSTHDAEEFKSLIVRMRNHEPAADYTHPINLPYYTGPEPGDAALAAYLASINLSADTKWNFEFKPLPRPTGKATRVIYTEYDMPRSDAEPHDVVVDSEGLMWYIDFAEADFGRMDPKTGESKEWKLPEFKAGFAPGSLGLALDKDGNPWIARSFQGGIATFNRKTEKITSYPIPKENDNVHARTSFIAISPVDGRVWFDDTFNRMMYSVDPKSGKMTGYPAYPGWKFDLGSQRGGIGPDGEKADHFMYGVAVDSKGTVYWGDLSNTNIGELDPETGKTKLYPTPTPESGPRRMHMTPDDQLCFAENNPRSRKIGIFNTKTKQFKEWGPSSPYNSAYDVVCDSKTGYVWAGGEPTDFVTRLDPKTGEMINYLLPTPNVNIRHVDVDDLTNPPSMILGENHEAKIVLIQPLE